jgi:hypothetical protein
LGDVVDFYYKLRDANRHILIQFQQRIFQEVVDYYHKKTGARPVARAADGKESGSILENAGFVGSKGLQSGG